MNHSEKVFSPQVKLGPYILTTILAWTLIVACILVWNLKELRRETRKFVLHAAQEYLLKYQVLFFWEMSLTTGSAPDTSNNAVSTSHDSSATRTRTIETSLDKHLALLSRPDLLRQLKADLPEPSGVTASLVSLKPLFVGNAPDEWERKALKAFEHGKMAMSEYTGIGDKKYLRLMQPMKVRPSCMKCHGDQGYKVGDIKGGIGIFFPMDQFLAEEDHQFNINFASFGLLWFLVLCGIGVGSHRLRRRIFERQMVELKIRRSYDTQSAVNSLLSFSQENIPLEEILERSLDLLLSISWLSSESKGGIFLVDQVSETLLMEASQGLSGPFQEVCVRVPFGRCLCGRAASTQQIQFAGSLDNCRGNSYKETSPHGHYCVPMISSRGKTIGAINLYLKESHRYDQTVVEFLTAIANSLAGIIERKQAEESLYEERSKLELMLKHETLLAYIASNFNSVDFFQQILDQILRTIGETVELGAACFQKFDDACEESSKLNSWVAGVDEQSMGYPPAISASDTPNIFKRLMANRMFVSSDIMELEEEREFLLKNNIQAMVICPLSFAGRIRGFLGFCQSRKRKWDPEERKLFRTIADLVINAWERESLFRASLEAEKKHTEAVRITEQASRLASIGVMAAGITHEINQPLNSIGVTAESVLYWMKHNQIDLPGKFSEKIEEISDHVDRIDSIIKHMREFWVTPTQIIEDEFDLNEAVRNSLSLIEKQISSHGISLELFMKVTALPVAGNRILLEQSVINLVVNSIHAHDESMSDDKKIEVITRKSGTSVILEVRDNAAGLPEGADEELFDPFYSTRKPGEGMGLGLAIAKRFISNLGGSIQADNNNNGGGAAFTIKLPLAR